MLEALRLDAMNYESFAMAKEKHLLSSDQEEDCLQYLMAHADAKSVDAKSVSEKSVVITRDLLFEMYGCKLLVYQEKKIPITNPVDVDLETARAESLYYSCRIAESLKICKVEEKMLFFFFIFFSSGDLGCSVGESVINVCLFGLFSGREFCGRRIIFCGASIGGEKK